MKKGISFLRNVVRLLIGILAVLGLLVLVTSPLLLIAALVVLCLSGVMCSWERTTIRAVWGLAFLGCFAILGIFIPVEGDKLAMANALRIGNNGRNIVLTIISANYEREEKGQTNVWPGVSADFSGTLKDYTKAPDAETYFTDLIDSECVENLSWSAFAGAGVAAASTREIFCQGDHNVWNVIAGLDENAPDDAPFLFTRNLNITMDDLRDESVVLRSRLDKQIKPFGLNLVVVVRKGGAMESLRGRQLTRENFLGSGVFNNATNRHATILKAKGLPYADL